MATFRITLIRLQILELFYRRPQEYYGLELIQALGISNGALYPALKRLSDAGYLTSRLEEIDEAATGRRKRRYYQLTPAGRTFAETTLATTPRLPTA